jgi:glycine dehydrogenase
MTVEERFVTRHLGPRAADVEHMLTTLGLSSLDDLVGRAVPKGICMEGDLDLPTGASERDALQALRELAAANEVYRSYLGCGYYDTLTPPVILRNVLENPAWYTAYTPYQAEISQGRLEALLLFQMVVQDLTALPVANASLLDEATAAAEAMAMSKRVTRTRGRGVFFVARDCHPQTIAVVQTRARHMDIEVIVGDPASFEFSSEVFGALVQYPATDGAVRDHAAFCDLAHQHKALVTVATDLLALALLRPPGEFGADIAVGSAQRFGVPLGWGGPHAGFLATRDAYVRNMPGRIIGLSRDAHGKEALRMALQTREQHIRRERATSNVCTAQVLLAVVAALYAVYHGPEGVRRIARRTHGYTRALAAGLRSAGFQLQASRFFDTLAVEVGDQRDALLAAARQRRINLRALDAHTIAIALDETVRDDDVGDLLDVFGARGATGPLDGDEVLGNLRRTSPFLTHPTFSRYHCETEMLRYLYRLQTRDLSLTTAMIPLGSCTMKLNGTTEMIPVTWEGFGRLHPFAPADQVHGYRALVRQLSGWLAEITGFSAVSLQPNAGSQGEYTGLLVIRRFHEVRGEGQRDVCLIPASAHGTNPASAAMAGMRVVAVKCDDHGNIDVRDLRARAEAHRDDLAALMVTYPSTHGVFEEAIREICDLVHNNGGQVYMDGANLNAMVGLCRPGDFGPDVLHLNLHKTFCIPHGGGGPGVGPICVAAHLEPFLPSHPLVEVGGEQAIGPVSAAPFGSPSILPITWAYIAMMGPEGLRQASQVAVLNANYVAGRLREHYPVLYTGPGGWVAHECILDCRPFKASAGVTVDDIAKRLMDYGFHAPTMSFPVAGTLMVEPTESESLEELDRFCDAMIAIREEISAIEAGTADPEDNPLKHAPHAAEVVVADDWNHAYSREVAAYPTPHQREHKFWPAVSRIDNVFGDKHMCTCLPMSTYAESSAE